MIVKKWSRSFEVNRNTFPATSNHAFLISLIKYTSSYIWYLSIGVMGSRRGIGCPLGLHRSRLLDPIRVLSFKDPVLLKRLYLEDTESREIVPGINEIKRSSS